MCSLCGILAGRGHWTDSGSSPEAFKGREEVHTVARERQQRVRILNRILQYYGLTISDWSTSAYLLKTRTGRTSLVNNLSELWPAAEALLSRPCDPLDPALIESLRAPPPVDRVPGR